MNKFQYFLRKPQLYKVITRGISNVSKTKDLKIEINDPYSKVFYYLDMDCVEEFLGEFLVLEEYVFPLSASFLWSASYKILNIFQRGEIPFKK